MVVFLEEIRRGAMNQPAITITTSSNAERPLSLFLFDGTIIRTFYDHTHDDWRFEAWRKGLLVDQARSGTDAARIDACFAQAVRRTLDVRRLHARRPVNAEYLPPGSSGIRTFDPRRRGSRSLFPSEEF